MKILVDVNLTPLWVAFFAAAGFESVHWTGVGLPSASDAEIMDYAAAHSFVIFTHDLDFGTLLAIRRAQGPSDSTADRRCAAVLDW
jgi:predicted nuclease of predicted toxin-antitoxin system